MAVHFILKKYVS